MNDNEISFNTTKTPDKLIVPDHIRVAREQQSAQFAAQKLENEMIARCAEICHEVNRVFCRALGDDSQPYWKDAPLWQKTSAINGVGFHLDNPTAGDSASHDNWMQEKLDAGWTYGEVKDTELKTHPCMVPFDELPAGQQVKDALFRTIIHAFFQLDEQK